MCDHVCDRNQRDRRNEIVIIIGDTSAEEVRCSAKAKTVNTTAGTVPRLESIVNDPDSVDVNVAMPRRAEKSDLHYIIKEVYLNRMISDTAYQRLSSFISRVSCVIITVWFITAYTVSGYSLERKYEHGESVSISPILQGITYVSTALFVVGLSGICLWKSEYPLVKTRGTSFIVGLALSCISTLLGTIMCIAPNYWDISEPGVYLWIRQATLLLGCVSVVAFLACRQSFLYYLFVEQPMVHKNLNRIWWITYISCIAPACIVFVTYTALSLSDVSAGYKMLFAIPYVLPLCLLLFYSYKSRSIGAGFCSWESNLRLAVFLIVFNLSIRIITAYIMPKTAGYETTPWAKLLKQYAFLYMISITMAESLLTIAMLAILQVQPLQCLDPKNTLRSSFGKSTPMPITQRTLHTGRNTNNGSSTSKVAAPHSSKANGISISDIHLEKSIAIESPDDTNSQSTLSSAT